MKEILLKKIAERKVIVGIVGLGYVGLPLAVEKANQGLEQLVSTCRKKKLTWLMPVIII